MKKMSGIYKIVNKTNGKYYVGSSNNIKSRWWTHKAHLNKNKHCNPHLQNAWCKYGKDAFDFIIVELLPQLKLDEREQHYLNEACNEKEKCYNSSFIVDHPPKLNAEQEKCRREKIGVTAKITWSNEELRDHQRHAGILHFSKEENRKKMSESLKKMRSNPLTEKRLNEAVRNAVKDKAIYKFSNTETGVVFTGLQLDFRNKYQIDSGNLSSVILGKRKSVSGWKLAMVVDDAVLHPANNYSTHTD